MTRNISRTPPPRQLGTKETLESLTHWPEVYIVPSFQFYSSPGVYLFTSNLENRWHENRASVSKTKYTNKKKDLETQGKVIFQFYKNSSIGNLLDSSSNALKFPTEADTLGNFNLVFEIWVNFLMF